jgi:hypothetical protein
MSEHPSDHDLWTGAAHAHVTGCHACSQRLHRVQRQQHDVREALQVLAGPVALPPQLDARLHAALAQQAAERPAIVVSLPQHRQRRWLAAAGVAAAAVVVAGVLVPPWLRDQAPRTDAVDGAVTEMAPDAGSGDLTVAPLPDDLQRLAQSLPDAGDDACGSTLAGEVGGRVWASAEPAAADREGVLVVVEGPDGRTGWWLPGCDAGAAQAWGSSSLP